MGSALRHWEVAGPELYRLLEEYERLHNITSNENEGKHHDDYTEFQKNDTRLLQRHSKIIFLHPLEENRLVVLDTGGAMNSDVETCLDNLLERNEERDKKFTNTAL